MEDDVIIEADGSEELNGEGSGADTKLAKLKRELAAIKKEKQEYLDGWQRAKADYVNALKRFETDRDAAKAKGIAKAAHAFIGVLDTLERAEAAGDVPEAFKSVAKQLHDAATSLGLMKFGAPGDPFDPIHHEALGQDPVDSKELDETVTAVLEPGWKAGDEVIRPAKVRVGHFQP
jgi:molecular chaperone GrpE